MARLMRQCVQSIFAVLAATAVATGIADSAQAQSPTQSPSPVAAVRTDSAAPARDPRTAQPERPTVATHAGTVRRGWIEIEAGIEADRGPGDASNHITTLVTKIGVARRAQLSIGINGSTPDGGRTGFGDLAVGLKMRIAEDHPLLGDFAIQPSLKFPTGSVTGRTGTGTTDASLLLISSRDAGPVHIDLNAGYTARGGDGSNTPKAQWVWTASFGGVLTGSSGWTAELYGYPGTGGASGAAPLVGLLFGPTFTVRNWLVLDIGAIVPVAGGQPHALYAGATYNVGRMF